MRTVGGLPGGVGVGVGPGVGVVGRVGAEVAAARGGELDLCDLAVDVGGAGLDSDGPAVREHVPVGGAHDGDARPLVDNGDGVRVGVADEAGRVGRHRLNLVLAGLARVEGDGVGRGVVRADQLIEASADAVEVYAREDDGGVGLGSQLD